MCFGGVQFLQLYSVARELPNGFVYSAPVFAEYFGPLAGRLIVDQWMDEARRS